MRLAGTGQELWCPCTVKGLLDVMLLALSVAGWTMSCTRLSRHDHAHVEYSVQGCFGVTKSSLDLDIAQDATVRIAGDEGSSARTLKAADGARLLHRLMTALQVHETVVCTSTTKVSVQVTYSIEGSQRTVALETFACDPMAERAPGYRRRHPDGATTNGGSSPVWSVVQLCRDIAAARGCA